MSPTDLQRPDPDALLARVREQERRAARGKLRVYFGASAGVGKTYAMLAAARKLQADGRPLLVGVVETHGRNETAALLEGLEVVFIVIAVAPVGVLAEVVEGESGLELSVRSVVGAQDGSGELRRSLVGSVDDPVSVGTRLAAILLEDGAADLAADPPPPPDGIPRAVDALVRIPSHSTEQVS